MAVFVCVVPRKSWHDEMAPNELHRLPSVYVDLPLMV